MIQCSKTVYKYIYVWILILTFANPSYEYCNLSYLKSYEHDFSETGGLTEN